MLTIQRNYPSSSEGSRNVISLKSSSQFVVFRKPPKRPLCTFRCTFLHLFRDSGRSGTNCGRLETSQMRRIYRVFMLIKRKGPDFRFRQGNAATPVQPVVVPYYVTTPHVFFMKKVLIFAPSVVAVGGEKYTRKTISH